MARTCAVTDASTHEHSRHGRASLLTRHPTTLARAMGTHGCACTHACTRFPRMTFLLTRRTRTPARVMGMLSLAWLAHTPTRSRNLYARPRSHRGLASTRVADTRTHVASLEHPPSLSHALAQSRAYARAAVSPWALRRLLRRMGQSWGTPASLPALRLAARGHMATRSRRVPRAAGRRRVWVSATRRMLTLAWPEHRPVRQVACGAAASGAPAARAAAGGATALAAVADGRAQVGAEQPPSAPHPSPQHTRRRRTGLTESALTASTVSQAGARMHPRQRPCGRSTRQPAGSVAARWAAPAGPPPPPWRRRRATARVRRWQWRGRTVAWGHPAAQWLVSRPRTRMGSDPCPRNLARCRGRGRGPHTSTCCPHTTVPAAEGPAAPRLRTGTAAQAAGETIRTDGGQVAVAHGMRRRRQPRSAPVRTALPAWVAGACLRGLRAVAVVEAWPVASPRVGQAPRGSQAGPPRPRITHITQAAAGHRLGRLPRWLARQAAAHGRVSSLRPAAWVGAGRRVHLTAGAQPLPLQDWALVARPACRLALPTTRGRGKEPRRAVTG
jgi:hypothetical protein